MMQLMMIIIKHVQKEISDDTITWMYINIRLNNFTPIFQEKGYLIFFDIIA